MEFEVKKSYSSELISALTGNNPIEVVDQVLQKIYDELKKEYPSAVEFKHEFSNSPLISEFQCILNMKDQHLKSPRQIVIEKNSGDMSTLLLKYFLNPTELQNGGSFLDEAIVAGSDQVVESILLQYPNMCNKPGNIFSKDTPLHLAVKNRNPKIVSILLPYIIKINSFALNDLDAKGLTPLHVTVTNGDYDSTLILLESMQILDYVNTPVSSKNPDRPGQTALHIAASNSNIEMVKLLLSYGSNINAIDVNGKIALDLSNLNCQIAKELLTNEGSRKILIERLYGIISRLEEIVSNNEERFRKLKDQITQFKSWHSSNLSDLTYTQLTGINKCMSGIASLAESSNRLEKEHLEFNSSFSVIADIDKILSMTNVVLSSLDIDKLRDGLKHMLSILTQDFYNSLYSDKCDDCTLLVTPSTESSTNSQSVLKQAHVEVQDIEYLRQQLCENIYEAVNGTYRSLKEHPSANYKCTNTAIMSISHHIFNIMSETLNSLPSDITLMQRYEKMTKAIINEKIIDNVLRRYPCIYEQGFLEKESGREFALRIVLGFISAVLGLGVPFLLKKARRRIVNSQLENVDSKIQRISKKAVEKVYIL